MLQTVFDRVSIEDYNKASFVIDRGYVVKFRFDVEGLELDKKATIGERMSEDEIAFLIESQGEENVIVLE